MNPKSKTPPPRSGSIQGYLAFILLFTVGAVGLWLYINRENIKEYRETYQSRQEAREKIAETRDLITRLKRQQQSLNYNGLESRKQMRERLQMHLPGEQVVYFENEQSTTATSPAAAGASDKNP